MMKRCFICVQEALSEKKAKAFLLHAFAADILEQVKPEALRNYLEQKIDERLNIDGEM